MAVPAENNENLTQFSVLKERKMEGIEIVVVWSYHRVRMNVAWYK